MDNRLVLGTAQLGMNYGIANKTLQPTLEKSCEIIKTAWENGIRYFDTAASYGAAESILGKVFKDLVITDKVFVISKIPGEITKTDESKILSSLDKSIKTLNINSFFGLLLHDPINLVSWNKRAERIVKNIKKNGIAKMAGVSVYKYEDALKTLRFDIFDMVQMPFNLFDQSFYKKNVFGEARAKNKQVFVRSIFLQGLLLLGPGQLKVNLSRFAEYMHKRDALCRNSRLSRKELAVGYVKKRAEGAHIIFGAETPKQVIETVGLLKTVEIKEELAEKIERDLSVEDENFINPLRWN